jgi:DNA sulfur modification protein DndD
MGIVIDKISFVNYRQYGTGSLSFNTSNESMLSIFIAKNGTGKTTILNAITWCLYGKELHLTDEKRALPIVTSAVVKESNVGDYIPVEVALTITDGNDVVEFKRASSCRVDRDSAGNNRVISSHDKITATITTMDQFSNTVVKEGNDADIVIKQYFDEAIFKFYFFDGEKLRDFFTAAQANSIKQSIFNISQITLLENSCNHLSTMNTERSRKLGKDFPDIARLNEAQTMQEKQRNTAEATLESNRELVDELSKKRDQLENILRGYEPVKNLQKERDELTEALNAVEKDTELLRAKRTSFIRRYTVLLSLYPRIKRTLSIIAEKEAAGDMPPAIDKDLIKKLLKNPEQHCPICDSSIDETALDHIQKLLTQYSVSSQTSNYLKEIKGPLESALDEISAFHSKLDELNQLEIDITERREKTEKRLSEIASALSNFENTSGQVNISEIEAKRGEMIGRIRTADQAIGAARVTIQNCDAEISLIEEQRKSALKKMGEHEDIRNQMAVISMLFENFRRIKTSIMNDMRDEIESMTWKYFDRMIWKKNTFGRIAINDSYDISVYNKEGTEMTGSLSATEQMALAYAFTLAIHNASGKNCPLVIDSPLGRVSDKNRENMAEALRDVSKTKQIIMLFTPDEYSDEVRTIYDGVATVKELVLSDDENYVEGVER